MPDYSKNENKPGDASEWKTEFFLSSSDGLRREGTATMAYQPLLNRIPEHEPEHELTAVEETEADAVNAIVHDDGKYEADKIVNNQDDGIIEEGKREIFNFALVAGLVHGTLVDEESLVSTIKICHESTLTSCCQVECLVSETVREALLETMEEETAAVNSPFYGCGFYLCDSCG